MLSEEEGIKAVIALQAMAEITETEETARAGWNKMNDNARVQTEAAYNMFCVAAKN